MAYVCHVSLRGYFMRFAVCNLNPTDSPTVVAVRGVAKHGENVRLWRGGQRRLGAGAMLRALCASLSVCSP